MEKLNNEENRMTEVLLYLLDFLPVHIFLENNFPKISNFPENNFPKNEFIQKLFFQRK